MLSGRGEIMNSIITVIAAVIGFIVTALSGFVIIPFLRKIHFGQTILDIGPKWHKDKQGTPIMGGFMFLFGTVVASVAGLLICMAVTPDAAIMSEIKNQTSVVRFIAGIVMTLCMGAIGFIDDYIKAVKHQNLGLKASQKTALQFIVGAGYLLTLYLGGMTTTWLPIVGYIDISKGFGLLFWPIALVFIYGFTNAVNLTDGVDGLAASVTFTAVLFYEIATASLSVWGYNLVAASLLGSLVGYLIWNLHPCKVMMGDTGSMLLGGIVVAFAFSTNQPILLILSGVMYLLEALSDIIQIGYYKRTKKRIFKMAPIHHHFEMCGWSENKIVIVFSLVNLVGCALATLLMIFA